MTPLAKPARSRLQIFRITSLLVPSAIAWHVVASAHAPDAITHAAHYVLGTLWCTLAASFAVRVVDAARSHRARAAGDIPFLDRIDVLTASGSALAWLGSGAIVLAAPLGWASLSIVGLLGLAIFHLVASWAIWATAGEDPWRRSSLTRRFGADRVVEGSSVVEELVLSSPRIPAGFRLFASGRIGPRWPTSRYVVDGRDGGGDVRLETELGPAVRGEHQAEPLEVWLQDELGLCHSMKVRVGEASLLVLPKPRVLRGAQEIVRAHGGVDDAAAALRAPTEGSLHLREYQIGDDARRIHWPRSLATGQTIVRTPDEIPRDPRSVRVVLDTYLPDPGDFTCPGPDELLDALVAIWLGVARAFGEAGLRVELVVADRARTHVAPLRQGPGRAAQASELGARATWQDAFPVARLLSKRSSVVVSYRHQPVPDDVGPTMWVLAREWAWLSFDQKPPTPSFVLLPHPMGSPENAGGRRRHEAAAHRRARVDHAHFARLCGDTGRTTRDTFLATPSLAGAIHVERLS